MSSTVLQSPTQAVLAEFISNAHAEGDVVTVFARCSVKYTGYREGEIGDGDRIIICKGDGAVTVHRPTGARAVARQGIRSSFEVIQLDDHLLIYAGKGDTETIRVRITGASVAVRYDANDDATLQENQTEEQMHEYILSNPDAIEDGFRIIEHERSTPHGRVDFYGADKEGNNVILEIKQPVAELPHVDQLRRYTTYFRQSEHASIRGILVAPSFKRHVKRTLRDDDLEWIKLDGFLNFDTAPGQTSIGDWD